MLQLATVALPRLDTHVGERTTMRQRFKRKKSTPSTSARLRQLLQAQTRASSAPRSAARAGSHSGARGRPGASTKGHVAPLASVAVTRTHTPSLAAPRIVRRGPHRPGTHGPRSFGPGKQPAVRVPSQPAHRTRHAKAPQGADRLRQGHRSAQQDKFRHFEKEGEKLKQEGNFRDAVSAFDQALSAARGTLLPYRHAEVLRDKASCLQALGRVDASLDVLARAIAMLVNVKAPQWLMAMLSAEHTASSMDQAVSELDATEEVLAQYAQALKVWFLSSLELQRLRTNMALAAIVKSESLIGNESTVYLGYKALLPGIHKLMSVDAARTSQQLCRFVKVSCSLKFEFCIVRRRTLRPHLYPCFR